MIENFSSRVPRPPFLVWRERLGVTRQEAAVLLGRTTRQLFSYEQGIEVPRSTLLAMAALEYLPPWRLADFGIEPTWRKRHQQRRFKNDE